MAPDCSPAFSITSWILLLSLHKLGTQATGNDPSLAQKAGALSYTGSIPPLLHIPGLNAIQSCSPSDAILFSGTFHLGNSHVFHQIIWWSFFFPHGRLNWCICTLTCLSNPWVGGREISRSLLNSVGIPTKMLHLVKLRPKDIKWLAESPSGSEWPSQDRN